MSKRIITGAVYVAVFLALIALKWLVPDGWGSLGFDALFCVIAIMGSLEITKAFKSVTLPQKIVTVAFCSVAVPLYVALQLASGMGSALIATVCCLAVYAIALLVIGLTHYCESTLRGTLLGIFSMVYVGFLCCILSAVNHLTYNSTAAMLILFFVVMLTDSGAFLLGSVLKRWIPWKLAPKISPNKTVIGGVGGLIGGIAGAVAAYYIYYGLGKVIGTPFVYGGSFPVVVAIILIGLIAAVFDQAGDLFESGIKRKCGIKDMGNVLPGHGGILDRFDSMLFCGVIILISFGLIVL